MSASCDSKYLPFEILVQDQRTPALVESCGELQLSQLKLFLLQKGCVDGANEGGEKKCGKEFWAVEAHLQVEKNPKKTEQNLLVQLQVLIGTFDNTNELFLGMLIGSLSVGG